MTLQVLLYNLAIAREQASPAQLLTLISREHVESAYKQVRVGRVVVPRLLVNFAWNICMRGSIIIGGLCQVASGNAGGVCKCALAMCACVPMPFEEHYATQILHSKIFLVRSPHNGQH
jgi:hypothetical protein